MGIEEALELLKIEVEKDSQEYKIIELLAEENPIEKIKPELKKRGAKEIIISILEKTEIKIETYLLPTSERIIEIYTNEEIRELNKIKENIRSKMLETKRINKELKEQITQYKA